MTVAELADHKLLDAARERTLARSARAGDSHARETLLRHNLRLVMWAIAAMRPPHDYRDDLASAGIIGLLEAIDRFDPDAGVRFSTYAVPHVRNALDEELARLKSPILIPTRERRILGKLHALRTNSSADGIKWETHRPQAHPVASLDRIVTNDGATTAGDLLRDPHVDIEAQVIGGDDPTTRRVTDALASLNDVQRRVLELRFGLTDHEHTTEETADAIGLTVDQSRWVEMQARRALRKLAADTTTTNDDDRLVRLIDPERFTDVTDLARAAGDTNTLGVEMRLYALAKRGVLERRHRAGTIEYRTCPQNPPVPA